MNLYAFKTSAYAGAKSNVSFIKRKFEYRHHIFWDYQKITRHNVRSERHKDLCVIAKTFAHLTDQHNTYSTVDYDDISSIYYYLVVVEWNVPTALIETTMMMITMMKKQASFTAALIIASFLLRKASSLSQEPKILFPSNTKSLVGQAASAISRAFRQDGIHRQIVRLPLSESMYSDKEEGFVADRAIGWQGGPQETYRYLSPLATDLLREVGSLNTVSDNDNNNRKNDGGLVARIKEQTLLDFDGTSLLTAESPSGAIDDIQAMLQPNTDGYYLKTINQIEEQFSDTKGKEKRMFLLINPAWRDKNSWGFFDAARAQKQILDRYETTFALDQFVVRGRKISLLRAWPNDWAVFLTPMPYDTADDGGEAKLIGTFSKRPEYAEMDALLLQKI